MTFRFDDISINTDMKVADSIAEHLHSLGHRVIYAISPLVHSNCGERVFPKIINAKSSLTRHYSPDSIGIPVIPGFVSVASHGLIHEDHRLLDYAAQELSILVSCSIVGSKIFVPPFNKWNRDTEDICLDNDIYLEKFENGWLSCEHNDFDSNHKYWYLHSRDWTLEKFKEWLK